MAKINFNFSQYDETVFDVCMDRLERAAEIIRDKAKANLTGFKHNWKEHGPYKSYIPKESVRDKKGRFARGERSARRFFTGKLPMWTARHYGDMAKTVRVFRSDRAKNVWVIAGNYEIWWATQMEFGRGGWRGGRKSFLRPAMHGAASQIIGVLEGGAVKDTVI